MLGEEGIFDSTFIMLDAFSSFVGMPIERHEKEIATVFRKLEALKNGKALNLMKRGDPPLRFISTRNFGSLSVRLIIALQMGWRGVRRVAEKSYLFLHEINDFVLEC